MRVRGSPSSVPFLFNDGFGLSLVLLTDSEDGENAVPQTTNETAGANQEKQGNTCDGTNDDTGNGTAAQPPACSSARRDAVIGLGGAGSCAGGCGGSAGNSVWCAVLCCNRLNTGVYGCADNNSSSPVLCTLPGIRAVLIRRAANRSASLLLRSGFRDAVGAVGARCGGDCGAPRLGVGLGLGPRRRVVVPCRAPRNAGRSCALRTGLATILVLIAAWDGAIALKEITKVGRVCAVLGVRTRSCLLY